MFGGEDDESYLCSHVKCEVWGSSEHRETSLTAVGNRGEMGEMGEMGDMGNMRDMGDMVRRCIMTRGK